MKTKHILAVLSTCLVAVSFSPINFFSQAAPPPPGFTMFDGKEFQFDVPDTTIDVWLPAFTCPAGRNMKIEDFLDDGCSAYLQIRVTRASNGQQVVSRWQNTYWDDHRYSTLILGSGDIVEYRIGNYPTISASIIGMID